MKDYLSNPDSERYDNYSLKKHLKERFKDSIVFSEESRPGRYCHHERTNIADPEITSKSKLWYGWERQVKMNPIEWGWKVDNNQLVPVMTQNHAAPDKLLKITHCNCSEGCRLSPCSCRRYGLPCTGVCGPCQTENCNNLNNTPENDTEEEDDTQT